MSFIYVGLETLKTTYKATFRGMGIQHWHVGLESACAAVSACGVSVLGDTAPVVALYLISGATVYMLALRELET